MYQHRNGVILGKLRREDLCLMMEARNVSWYGIHTFSLLTPDDQDGWYAGLTWPRHLALIAEFGQVPVQSSSPPQQDCRFGAFLLHDIDWPNRVAHCTWYVFPRTQGRGLGRLLVEAGRDFAFEMLNVRRLDAEILANNLASIRCAEAAGFRHEGTRRQAVERCRELLDSRLYGLLRDHWYDLVTAGPQNSTYSPKRGTGRNRGGNHA